MAVQPSVCPLDCPDRCTLEVTVENDRVVKLDGSHRSDYTDGYICAKVRGFTARQYSPERVLRPMKRVGPKGAGLSETISWDEALQRIAERFTGIANTSGPEAILPFHYDGSNGLITSLGMDDRFWNRLGASNLARTFCAANTGAGWAAVFGDLPGCDPMDIREFRRRGSLGREPIGNGHSYGSLGARGEGERRFCRCRRSTPNAAGARSGSSRSGVAGNGRGRCAGHDSRRF